jgi:hypothetical protein
MSIAKTKDTGLILAGYSISNASYEKSENNKGGAGNFTPDYWIVKLDTAYNIEWDKTIGGDTSDFLISIKEPRRKQFVLGGYSYSGISADKTKPSRGKADFWLVGLQYTPTALLQSSDAEKAVVSDKRNGSLLVYPNPVKDILHIQNAGKATVTLTDQQGKTILTKTINGNEAINVSQLPAGLYYLKNNETGEAQKIMITK